LAFTDSQHILYNGSVKITYKDKAHRYFCQDRISWDLPTTDEKAWGKMISTKGVTTMMDAVLEKKGLMTWPLGLALRELFGFYDFKNEHGEQMTGFSKGIGSIWELINEVAGGFSPTEALPRIYSASKAWQRKKKTGADIGSLVHDAIEHHIHGQEFSLDTTQYKLGQEFGSPEAEAEWDAKAADEIAMAELALNQFVIWWFKIKPELVGAEQLVYSKTYDFCGTYDCLVVIDGKTILGDYKTSNASTSKEAAAPEGVYYSYMIQLGFYALAHEEMGGIPIDDLVAISCRKDGGFSEIYASDLGLTVEDCKGWAKSVINCYTLATKTKKALLARVGEKDGE
jgi:hypothetical protein